MTVGEVIYGLRIEERVSQGELARGIISDSFLSRFENNEKKLDKIIVASLFQRLGKTFDKLEFQVSVGEYRMILLREQLIKCLETADEKLLVEYMGQYERIYNKSHKLEKQYYLLIKASEAYLIKRDKTKCLVLLKEAIEVTFPEWEICNWNNMYLCIQEVQILTMIAYVYMLMDNPEAEDLIKKNIDFINRRYTDAEEKPKILTPAYWVYIRLLLKSEREEEALIYCKLAKENLANIGMIVLMDRILDIEIKLTENLEKKEKLQGQYDAICFVKKLIGKEDVDEYYQILKTNHQRELYISNETLKDVRIASNISQEELSYDICSYETISRVESGKRTLSHKKRLLLYNKLHIDPNLYGGNVVSNDYEVHRLVREFARLWYKKELEKAMRVLKKIEKKLDMSIPTNKQFVEHWKVMEKVKKSKITYEKAGKELEKILNYTIKFNEGIFSRIPSKTELQAVVDIMIFYKKQKLYHKSIEMYRNLLEKYEKSSVDEMHHAKSMILIYLNYAGVLEEAGQLKESKVFAMKGIELAYNCGRGDTIGTILANMSCIYIKEDNQMKFWKYLNHSINLLLLYKHDNDVEMIKSFYKLK